MLELRMMVFLTRLRANLPIDGQGFANPADPHLRALRRWAARRFWQRVPVVFRPFAIVLARLAWLVTAPARAVKVARQESLSVRETACVTFHAVWSGAQPNEAFIWRSVFPGFHPLPGRAVNRLLPLLGDPAQRQFLADKHAAAEFLSGHGLAVPMLHARLLCGQAVDLSERIWSGQGPLFVKPRHGSAGRGARRVDVTNDRRFRIAGGTPMEHAAFAAWLGARLANDDLLVQEYLAAAPDLTDFAPDGNPPVLRLTTARMPQAEPVLHSALLCIDVPGENPRHFIRGQLRIPVDPVRGCLGAGIWFRTPGQRYAHLPWSKAPVTGRRLPAFASARGMVLRAMALFPGLPLVNWDLILTPRGPVLLEGNTSGDWILTNLPVAQGLGGTSLVSILSAWRSHGESNPGFSLERAAS